MAIDKKLIHFNKDEDFQKENEAGNILNKSIIFTGDEKKIYTHGEEYKTVTWGKLITPSYEIDDKDPNNWIQGTEHSLTIKRLTENFNGQRVLNLTCEGGTLDKNTLTDDGSNNWEEDITITPSSDHIELEIKSDKKIKSDNFNKEEIGMKKEVQYQYNLDSYLYTIGSDREGFDDKQIIVSFENADEGRPSYNDYTKLKIIIKGFEGNLKIKLSAPLGFDGEYQDKGSCGGVFEIGKLDTILSRTNDVYDSVIESDKIINYTIPDNKEHSIEITPYYTYHNFAPFPGPSLQGTITILK